MMLRILCCSFLLIASLAAAHAADRLITVTGEGTVAVAPDAAVIRVGVSTQGKTAAEASNANAQKMTAVLGAIKDAGIAERDVQTAALSLQPQYESTKPGAPRLTGFQVSNQVTVRVRDVKAMPGLLDRAIAAGANEMSGIEFVVSEQSKLLDEARGQAVADARRKAELYAQAAGGHVGRVVAITEEGAPSPVRPVMSAMRAGAAIPVAPGEQTLKSAVTVSYMLEP
jgi:uncharacterized protein YggE